MRWVNNISLETGDLFTPYSELTPVKYADLAKSYSSDDTSIATVVNETIEAKSNGSATIETSVFTDKKYYINQEVEVGALSYTGMSSARAINSIVVARKPSSIEVGEEYVCQAYALSPVTESHPYKYGYSDDNLVYFTSSNNSVCKVKNGVLTGVSVGNVTITVHDVSNTVITSFAVSVVSKTSLSYTTEEVYIVADGELDTTDEESTTLGIIDILEIASTGGYKKVIFPNDTYYVSPVYGTIYIPTQMIVDFSDSIIQIVESAMTTTGYTMIVFQNTEYSSLENVKIYGERFISGVTPSNGCRNIGIWGSNYRSGLYNVESSDSYGFNVSFGNTNRKIAPFRLSDVESGGLDSYGNDTSADYSYRNNGYIDISSIGSLFGFGNMQGYQGYLYLSARVYDICFYDSNHTFLTKYENCIQYYLYDKPNGAVYARIAFCQGFAPTSGDPDFHAIAHIYSQDHPISCYVRNCVFKHNRLTGLAPNGGDGWIIEGCTFEDNGQVDPASHIDWEDGRNNNKGHILRGSYFYSGTVTIFGADGTSIHNNVFHGCRIRNGNEVQNSRIYLNQFIKGNAEITTKTDMLFSQNYGVDGSSITLTNVNDVDFEIRATENDFT